MGTTTARRAEPVLTTAVVSLADSGNIIAAVSGKKLVIWFLELTNSDPTKTVVFKSGTTALSGAELFDKGRWLPVVIRENTYPAFETAAGEAFVVTLSAAANLAGRVIYSEE